MLLVPIQWEELWVICNRAGDPKLLLKTTCDCKVHVLQLLSGSISFSMVDQLTDHRSMVYPLIQSLSRIVLEGSGRFKME